MYISKNEYKKIDFSKYSSIKIGPKTNILVINEIADYKNYQILGLANNVLISNNPPSFCTLGSSFDYIIQKNNKLYIGASTKSSKVLAYIKKHNIAHLEFLGKLPGSIGGLVKMNAGLKEYEIFNLISSIKTKDGYISKSDIEYSYRHTNINTIIYEVVINIEYGFSQNKTLVFKNMRNNQPNEYSAGSCFKNPQKNWAAKLIEGCNLKGFRKGDMQFSNKHSNFLINLNNGTFDDAIYLINLAKDRVKEKYNINLEEEIIIYDKTKQF